LDDDGDLIAKPVKTKQKLKKMEINEARDKWGHKGKYLLKLTAINPL
jgi:hypothetical protein